MPNNPHTSPIAWRDWDEQVFQTAQVESKPLLLSLTLTWCHAMGETSYSDQHVIYMVNDRFIQARVDVDQRPDLSARYNQGGFPSLAFLDTDGQTISGSVYNPPWRNAQVTGAGLRCVSLFSLTRSLGTPKIFVKAVNQSDSVEYRSLSMEM